MNQHWYRQEGNDLLLFLRIQPRSSQEGFAEILNNERKLRIKAPPVDGQANRYLIKYLAKLFKVPKNRVMLESGQSSRSKCVRIIDMDQLPASLL